MKPAVEAALARTRGSRLPYPYWINIENTLRCNLSCPMCLQHITGTTRSGIDMDLGLFERIAEELFPHVQRVCWSVAGEPMLAPHFRQFLQIANRYPIKTEIVTNATLLHRRGTMEALMPTLDLFQVSLDGATRATYESIRAGGKWKQTIANLRLFQRVRMATPATRRPRFHLAFVLMRQNVHELPLFVELAHELGADRAEANHMLIFDESVESDSLLHAKARANRAFDAARKRAADLGIGLGLPQNYLLEQADHQVHEPHLEEGGMTLDLPPADGPHRSGLKERIARFTNRRKVRRVLVAIDRRERRLRRLERARVDGIRRWSETTGLADRCDYLWGKVYISAGGDVSPCCMPGRPIVGNLVRSRFDEIWNGEDLNHMRAHLSAGDPYECCAHCSLFRETLIPDDEAIWRREVRKAEPGAL